MALPRVAVNGRLTADPDLRFSQNGKAVGRLRLATSDRKKEGDQWVDGDTLFINATVFGQAAENAAESLKKGDLVIVSGRLKTEEWTTAEGQKRSAIVILADAVAADLTFRTLPHGGAAHAAAAAEVGAPAVDPWATPSGGQPGF